MRMKKYTAAALLVVASIGQAQAPAPKIVGGSDTSDSYPWMAGLHSYNPDSGLYFVYPFCGGSLIAPGWVLTAAHCLDDGTTAGEVLVRINQPALCDSAGCPGGSSIQPDHEAAALVLHNNYVDVGSGFDIALVQLTSKTGLDTVSLADVTTRIAADALPTDNGAVIAMGWGVYDDASFNPDNAGDGNQPHLLQSVVLDYLRRALIPGSNPANIVGAWEPDPDPGTQPFGADACFGDSGGPLFIAQGNTTLEQSANGDVLVGLTSYGSGACNSRTDPGAYTDVSAYSSWIEQQTQALGDPLVDAAVSLSAPGRDLVPGSTSEFVLTVSNRSSLIALSDFRVQLTSSVDIGLAASADSTLSCTPGGAGVLVCDDTGTLPANTNLGYRFSVTDLSSLPRDATITATLTDLSHDDYRVGNNSAEASVRYTTAADAGVSLTDFDATTGRFLITVTNTSDANSATGVSLALTSNLPLDFSDTGPCVADSDTQVSCTLGDMAPLATFSQEISLPRARQVLSYDLTATVSTTSADSDSLNDSDSRAGFSVAALKKRSSGGGASLIAVLLLALAGLRRPRKHTA